MRLLIDFLWERGELNQKKLFLDLNLTPSMPEVIHVQCPVPKVRGFLKSGRGFDKETPTSSENSAVRVLAALLNI
jgi:hypothetical protein